MIIHFGSDLMMASALGGAARTAGVPFRSLTTLPKLEELLAGDSPPRMVIVDLQAPGFDFSSCAELLRGHVGGATEVIWFAQHVLDDLLEAARETGIGETMTRGQLHARVGKLVAGVAGKTEHH